MLKKVYDLNFFQNDINEILLADIALKIQLTPSEYDDAVAHYGAIEKWLEREDSPLKGRVIRIYPQGSMAIHTTISSRQDAEEFDIDLVIELGLLANSDPEEVLDLLFDAVRGEPGSKYFSATKRNTRCVTIHYRNMHLDLCPAVLMPGRPERTSTMFHHNGERNESYCHIRNPWGFADWFNGSVPEEKDFSIFYRERGLAAIKAEAEPVPELTPVYQKPRTVVALQLLKRFRNHRFLKRPLKGPPSVVLSKLAIDAGGGIGGIFDELMAQASHLESVMATYRLEVRNPSCQEDDFLTDRWPNTPDIQREFYRDVRYLQRQLLSLKQASELVSKQKILSDLFGERATSSAFESLQKRYDELSYNGEVKVDPKTAGIAIAASGIAGPAILSSTAVAAPFHYNHSTKSRYWAF